MNLLSSTEKFLHRILGSELDFDLKNYLIKGSFFSVSIQVFSMGLNFLIGIVLARLIGAEGYGIFTYAFTLLSVTCTIATFGMDDLLVREVSMFQSRHRLKAIKAIMKWTVQRALFFSALISVIFLLMANFSDIVTDGKRPVYNIISLGIPVFSLVMILQAVQRGLHRVIPGQLPEKVIRPVTFIFLVSLLYLYDKTLLPEHPFLVIMLNILAYAAALFVLIVQILKMNKSSGTASKTQDLAGIDSTTNHKTAWLKSSFYFFIATLVASINVRADILMLGWMKADADVGIYNAAARFSDLAAFALLILTPIIAPSLSRLFALNEKEKLQQLVSKAAKANFIFALMVTVFLIIWGNFPLKIFGDEFTAGYYAMLLLCGGQLITTFAGPAGNILLMTGFEKLAFYSGLAGTIINITLNLVLIPRYGINGAAAATAVSLFAWNGLQTFFVFRKLKINPTVVRMSP